MDDPRTHAELAAQARQLVARWRARALAGAELRAKVDELAAAIRVDVKHGAPADLGDAMLAVLVGDEVTGAESCECCDEPRRIEP